MYNDQTTKYKRLGIEQTNGASAIAGMIALFLIVFIGIAIIGTN